MVSGGLWEQGVIGGRRHRFTHPPVRGQGRTVLETSIQLRQLILTLLVGPRIAEGKEGRCSLRLNESMREGEDEIVVHRLPTETKQSVHDERRDRG